MAVDVNEVIAQQMRDGIDALEYGPNGRLSDPQVESIAYARGAPWWVGTYRDTARREELAGLATGPEILAAAGLDFEVNLKDIYVGRRGAKIEGSYATVRSDTDAPLGVVGRGYKVVQNSVLAEFGDAIVDSGEAKYETAGSLREGRRVFLSMELDHLEINVRGQREPDELRTYLLLTNSHDGSMSLNGSITPIRSVCWNTNNMAMRRARSNFRLRHTARIEGRIAAAREALGVTFRYLDEFKELAQALSLKNIVDDQVAEIMKAVWPVPEDLPEGRVENHHSTKALDLYYASPNLEGIRGTAWGALQAVTEYLDWGVEYKPRGEAVTGEDLRAERILWGGVVEKKEAAVKALLAL